MKLAIRDADELCRELELPPEVVSRVAAGQFPVFVPREFLSRMGKGDVNDPLLLQVLPLPQENELVEGYGADPLGEFNNGQFRTGLLHKYRGRALLVLTGTCAVHCRYCFRRHFPYEQRPLGIQEWNRTMESFQSDADLEEVILSGGDPLTLGDRWLAKFVGKLETVPQLRRMRIHTRLPIMIPSRINASLLKWATSTRLTTIFVVHVNHPRELDGNHVGQALSRLVDAGIPVLNQSVLLRGVNDNIDSLTELSRRLIDLRVIPYYLHQLDPVAGAAHFAVPVESGKRLIHQMRQRLPGYAVPRFAVEKPGHSHKTILA